MQRSLNNTAKSLKECVMVIRHLLKCAHMVIFTNYVLDFAIMMFRNLEVVRSAKWRLSFMMVTVDSVALVMNSMLKHRLNKIAMLIMVHVSDLATVEGCGRHLTHGLFNDEMKRL